MIRALALLAALAAAPAWAGDLPEGFVRLSAIAPQIAQDIRYAGAFNFTGAPIPGYGAAECIVTKTTARRLMDAEVALNTEGYALIVYDCYRPQRAVRHFMTWAAGEAGPKHGPDMGFQFFPGLARADLIPMGYIARASRHSWGTTVDVGLRRMGEAPPLFGSGSTCDGPSPRRGDTSVDMGTSFDCFSTLSGAAALIDAEPKANRARLSHAMAAAGFVGYAAEWWHFRQADDPATTPMDFPIR